MREISSSRKINISWFRTPVRQNVQNVQLYENVLKTFAYKFFSHLKLCYIFPRLIFL